MADDKGISDLGKFGEVLTRFAERLPVEKFDKRTTMNALVDILALIAVIFSLYTLPPFLRGVALASVFVFFVLCMVLCEVFSYLTREYSVKSISAAVVSSEGSDSTSSEL